MTKNKPGIKNILIVLAMFCCLATPRVSVAAEDYFLKRPKAFTVQEAYEFFGYERTPFSREESTMPEFEARYLEHLFRASDMAMQASVNMMQHFFAGRNLNKERLKEYLQTVENIRQSFALNRAPTKELRDVQELFLFALEDQRDFFIKWSMAYGPEYIKLRKTYEDHELVQSSHFRLQRVYTQLMLLYPEESPYNHKAFYSHLNAMDFIINTSHATNYGTSR